MLASAFALTFVFWGLFEAYYDVYTTASSQAETLTGRLGIWAYMLAEAVQQPWLGHGFDSVWNVVPPFGAEKFEAAMRTMNLSSNSMHTVWPESVCLREYTSACFVTFAGSQKGHRERVFSPSCCSFWCADSRIPSDSISRCRCGR